MWGKCTNYASQQPTTLYSNPYYGAVDQTSTVEFYGEVAGYCNTTTAGLCVSHDM